MEEKEKIRKFMDELKKEDFNVIEKWDSKRFKIECQECMSKNTLIFFREEEGKMGSEYTGYMPGFIHNNGIVVKCKDCGLAMVIENLDY